MYTIDKTWSNPLKTMGFFHDDLDGAGVTLLYRLAHMDEEFGKDYAFVNVGNNEVDQAINDAIGAGVVGPDTKVLFADISPRREVLEYLQKCGYDIMIVDHHRTNFFATQIYPDAIIVPQNELGVLQSGTSLLYQWYSQRNMEPDVHLTFLDPEVVNQRLLAQWVDCVRAYDIYEWKEKGDMVPKYMQTLFFLLGMDRYIDKYIKKLTNLDDDKLIDDTDMEFIQARLENEQAIIESFTPDDVYQFLVRGKKAAFIMDRRGANISELANQFLTKYPEFDIMVGFSLVRNGEFSFRTVRDDIDLGADFANPIGGGGHPKAAGAPLSDHMLDRFINHLIDELNRGYFG